MPLLSFLVSIDSPTGNYNDSLKDAKIAIDLQPRFVKAIIRGKVKGALSQTFCCMHVLSPLIGPFYSDSQSFKELSAEVIR